MVPSSIANSGLLNIPFGAAQLSEGDEFVNCAGCWDATVFVILLGVSAGLKGTQPFGSACSCAPEAVSNAPALLWSSGFAAKGNRGDEPFFISCDGSEAISPFISSLFCEFFQDDRK